MACMREYSVCFRMCSQAAWLRECIFTLDAIVGVLPTVRYQMCPQIACLYSVHICIVALIARVRLASNSIAWIDTIQLALIAF